MAVILALEGGFDMEGDLDVLRLFHRLGVRLIQFSNHETANAMTDTWSGEQPWGGITDHGRAVIREMNRLGIMIDISHSSEKAQYQIIEASEAPVVDSHTSLSQFSSRGREMSDELLKALAAKGGMMAMEHHGGATSKKWTEWRRTNRPPSSGSRRMNLVRSPDKDYGQYIEKLDNELHDRWTRSRSDERGGTGYGTPWRDIHKELADAGAPFTTDAEWAEQAVFVTNLVGDDHIGIGLDMMSGTSGGLADFDATSYGRLTDAMLAKDLSERTVRKILGGNWLRLLDAAKVPDSQ